MVLIDRTELPFMWTKISSRLERMDRRTIKSWNLLQKEEIFLWFDKPSDSLILVKPHKDRLQIIDISGRLTLETRQIMLDYYNLTKTFIKPLQTVED